MTENLRNKINHHIQWLTNHSHQDNAFSSKKNDQLLQNLVNDLLLFSTKKMSSDIHLEPQENTIRIRLRVDGVLSEHFILPKYIHNQLCCKLKIMANIDIAQTRQPQDGKFIFHSDNSLRIHIRISTCPTVRGEKIVLRLLKDNQHAPALNSLGMNLQQLDIFTQAISNPHGLILITGPTGSGKTSTLYSAISHINTEAKNVITIEDPVEVQISGVNQININLKADLSFSSALRSILRQDPDVIMIGEIRDEETAKIAIKAANTGHLVLATLHTNNCIETINRLSQMNLDRSEFISCLNIIISQRLLRKKCPYCTHDKIKLNCECTNGYFGRHGIFEMLSLSESLKNYIINNPYCKESDITQSYQFISLHQQALSCVREGTATFEEVKRVFNLC